MQLTTLTPLGIKTYREFWPYYVMEHVHPQNRHFHFIGTALTFVFIGLALVKAEPLWLLGMPIVGYGFAWYGHFFIQKNKPATFKYPFWSFISDYRMFFLILKGKMNQEIAKSAQILGRRS